jgi:tetratricopeptide (TPR) repeat protein
MRRTTRLLVILALATAAQAQAPSDHTHEATHTPATLEGWAQGATLYQGLGRFHRSVTTSSAQAQAYFDQGMRFLWAFNHDESTRSFARAAQLDRACAACYWGLALTVGPNYNVPTTEDVRARVAWEALKEAQKHAAATSAVEQALIGALAARYPAPRAPADAEAILKAYSAAMQQVASRFPADDDVQVLCAEAQMTVHAWKLWTADGHPVPGTLEIESRLESVLARAPDHPGANHYYIHLMEASPTPQKAVAAAERLRGMMPAAGHLEHMPAHIMQRVGRYEEAAEANRRGVAADNAYLAQTVPPDYYAMYLAHNQAFLAYSVAMEGRKAETLDAVQALAVTVPVPMLLAMHDSGWRLAEQYAALVRFGLWDELIALQAPDTRLPGLSAGYFYGRGVGLAARGRVAEARQTLAELHALRESVPADTFAGYNRLKDLIAVAEPIVAARIAASERRDAEAVRLLEEAVAAEDALAYDEPADWFFPARHLLGAQLLLMGQPAAAQRVYTEDLRRNPNNGWSLFGLMLAAKAQGKIPEAELRANEQQRAWQRADVRLPGSAFWYAGADTASCECQHFASGQGHASGELLGAQDEARVH